MSALTPFVEFVCVPSSIERIDNAGYITFGSSILPLIAFCLLFYHRILLPIVLSAKDHNNPDIVKEFKGHFTNFKIILRGISLAVITTTIVVSTYTKHYGRSACNDSATILPFFWNCILWITALSIYIYIWYWEIKKQYKRVKRKEQGQKTKANLFCHKIKTFIIAKLLGLCVATAFIQDAHIGNLQSIDPDPFEPVSSDNMDCLCQNHGSWVLATQIAWFCQIGGLLFITFCSCRCCQKMTNTYDRSTDMGIFADIVIFLGLIVQLLGRTMIFIIDFDFAAVGGFVYQIDWGDVVWISMICGTVITPIIMILIWLYYQYQNEPEAQNQHKASKKSTKFKKKKKVAPETPETPATVGSNAYNTSYSDHRYDLEAQNQPKTASKESKQSKQSKQSKKKKKVIVPKPTTTDNVNKYGQRIEAQNVRCIVVQKQDTPHSTQQALELQVINHESMEDAFDRFVSQNKGKLFVSDACKIDKKQMVEEYEKIKKKRKRQNLSDDDIIKLLHDKADIIDAHNNAVETLKEMGYDSDSIEHALEMIGDNIEMAVQWLSAGNITTSQLKYKHSNKNKKNKNDDKNKNKNKKSKKEKKTMSESKKSAKSKIKNNQYSAPSFSAPVPPQNTLSEPNGDEMAVQWMSEQDESVNITISHLKNDNEHNNDFEINENDQEDGRSNDNNKVPPPSLAPVPPQNKQSKKNKNELAADNDDDDVVDYDWNSFAAKTKADDSEDTETDSSDHSDDKKDDDDKEDHDNSFAAKNDAETDSSDNSDDSEDIDADNNAIKTLKEMGFDLFSIEHALEINGDNIEMAVQWLSAGNDQEQQNESESSSV